MILSLRGVTKRFPSHHGAAPTAALEAIDLGIEENEFVTILGPSGCGKSTLLRIVAGLEAPSSGEVMLDGRAVTGPGADRGMVFQSYTLFPWLDVQENIGFGLRERRVPRSEQHDVVRAWIAAVGLEGFEHHYPRQLSGGMQQRVAIARALANGPKILLMDEPFGALDPQTRERMQALLLGLWERERKTVLFVTHDVGEAVFLGSRIVVLSARPGRIRDDRAIGLAHPRRHEDLEVSPSYIAERAHLATLVRAEARRTPESGNGGP